MPRHRIAGATAVGAFVFLASCSDQREPVGPSEPPSGPGMSAAQGTPSDPAALARAVPGFGGFFLDAVTSWRFDGDDELFSVADLA